MCAKSLEKQSKATATCQDKHIYPVRYALASGSNSPLEGSPLKCSALPKLDNHQFTLRVISKGYIFLTHKALEGEIAVYKMAGQQNFKQISAVGGSGGQTITIPEEIDVLKLLYLRLPKEENNQDAYWKAVAENLKSDPSCMQEINLNENFYSAPIAEAETLVEEFHSEEGARLEYALDIDNAAYTIFNRTSPRKTRLTDRWHVSHDKNAYPRRLSTFPQETTLLALHDAIGNIYDCVQVHTHNLQEIELYQRWRSPVLLNSVFLDMSMRSVRDRCIAQGRKNIEANQATIGGFSGNPGWALETLPDKLKRYDKEMEELANNEPEADEYGALQYNQLWVNYVAKNTSLESHEIKEMLDTRSNQVKKYYNELNFIYQADAAVISDWVKLLSGTGKFALSKVLGAPFKAADQSAAHPGSYAEPLTQVRGAIFAACHLNIGETPNCAEQLDKLFSSSAYLNLATQIIGHGGAPGDEYGAYLACVTPYLSARASRQGLDDQAIKQVTAACAQRLDVDAPKKVQTNDPIELFEDAPALIISEDTLDSIFANFDTDTLESGLSHLQMVNDSVLKLIENYLQELGIDVEKLKREAEAAAKAYRKSAKTANKYMRGSRAKRKAILAAFNKQQKRLGLPAWSSKDYQKKIHKDVAIIDKEIETFGSKLDKSMKTKSTLHKIKTPLHYSAQALNFFGVFMAGINFSSVSAQAITELKQGNQGRAMAKFAQATPSGLAVVEYVRTDLLKKGLSKFFTRCLAGAVVISSGIDLYDLYSQKEYKAMVGSTLMAASGLGLIFISSLAQLMGVTSLLPPACLLAAVFAAGFTIYAIFKDEDDVAFINNNFFNADKSADLNALLNIAINPRQKQLEAIKPWQKQNIFLQKYINQSCAPQVNMHLDDNTAYINVQAFNFFGSPDWQIEFKPECVYRLNGPQHGSFIKYSAVLNKSEFIKKYSIAATPTQLSIEYCYDLALLDKNVSKAYPAAQKVGLQLSLEGTIVSGHKLSPQKHTLGKKGWLHESPAATQRLEEFKEVAHENI